MGALEGKLAGTQVAQQARHLLVGQRVAKLDRLAAGLECEDVEHRTRGCSGAATSLRLRHDGFDVRRREGRSQHLGCVCHQHCEPCSTTHGAARCVAGALRRRGETETPALCMRAVLLKPPQLLCSDWHQNATAGLHRHCFHFGAGGSGTKHPALELFEPDALRSGVLVHEDQELGAKAGHDELGLHLRHGLQAPKVPAAQLRSGRAAPQQASNTELRKPGRDTLRGLGSSG
mmetsp:Transcript_58347/g.183142  ORF Transcript_58347/g.183142 Transcript_58347/m.183142 type:complete len:232 (+) Transcript_58347:313-1008(+)